MFLDTLRVVVRDFNRLETLINYDEAHKSFFFIFFEIFLRFGGAMGCCARYLYL